MREFIRKPAIVFLVMSMLWVTACSDVSPGPQRSSKKSSSTASAQVDEPVTVTGAWGETPTVTFALPLADTHTRSEVLVEGDGPKLRENDPVLLAIHATSGSTGKVLRDDFSSTPQTYLFTATALGSDLYDSLKGVRVGSRVLHVVADTVPLVMTIDVFPLEASGIEVTDIPTTSGDGGDVPEVTTGEDGTPVIHIDPKAKAPQVLTTVPLMRGEGPQVQAGQTAVIRYVAARWSTGKVSDSTWTAGTLPATVTIGADALIEGLDSALTEVPVGSRVLVIVPPGQAFGLTEGKLKDETMVYVIDVLAASVPATTAGAATDQPTASADPASPTEGMQ